MIAWWLLPSLCFLAITCEPIAFDQLFSEPTTFFSPDDPTLGSFSEFSFDPPAGMQLASDFEGKGFESFSPGAFPFASESDNVPVYTDGMGTDPQLTLSHLQRDFTAQLRQLTKERQRSRPRYTPKFVSQPFPSASSKNERTPPFSKLRSAEESRQVFAKSSSPIVQTGFVPIIKGSSQDQSRRGRNFASSVIKDIEPPILTAAPGSQTSRPSHFNVAASVVSSSRVPTSGSQNSSANELRPSARAASYSRLLNVQNDSTVLFSEPASSSERVIFLPESAHRQQYKDSRQQSRSSESADTIRVAAKRTLDLNCDGSSDLGWCELGEKYPRKYVNQVISSCPAVVDRLYVEVPHVFEKLSDVSDFKSELDNSSQRSARERSNHDAWSWASYVQQGSLCDSETGFLRPETAKDTNGTWNIVVQTEAIRQRVPIEMCRESNSPCRKVPNCGLKSQCVQKYNYHLLMSLNPTKKHDCPFMKLYRFPSGCVCHVE